MTSIFLCLAAALALLVMAYGFGWCDGRESMRRDLTPPNRNQK